MTMNKEKMTNAILKAKKEKGMTWADVAGKMNMGETWVASACLGMNSMPEQNARDLCEVLELGDKVCAALQEFPHKAWEKTIPQDPVVYRLYEIVGVYGDTIKDIIHVEGLESRLAVGAARVELALHHVVLAIHW